MCGNEASIDEEVEDDEVDDEGRDGRWTVVDTGNEPVEEGTNAISQSCIVMDGGRFVELCSFSMETDVAEGSVTTATLLVVETDSLGTGGTTPDETVSTGLFPSKDIINANANSSSIGPSIPNIKANCSFVNGAAIVPVVVTVLEVVDEGGIATVGTG